MDNETNGRSEPDGGCAQSQTLNQDIKIMATELAVQSGVIAPAGPRREAGGNDAVYVLPEVLLERRLMDAIRKELRDHARHALIDMNRQKAEGKIARIEVAPGFGFCRFLGHVCPKKYRERVLEAFHAEATKDYFDALKSQDHVRARMIKLCMYPQMAWQVLGALLSQLFAAVCGKFGKPSSDE